MRHGVCGRVTAAVLLQYLANQSKEWAAAVAEKIQPSEALPPTDILCTGADSTDEDEPLLALDGTPFQISEPPSGWPAGSTVSTYAERRHCES